MQIFVLVALSMIAFAANSVLTRVGVATFGLDPMVFAAIRIGAGALTLAIVVRARGGNPLFNIKGYWRGALALGVYVVGFSWAYQSLDAGLGALILFGSLQVMMFGWAVWKGQSIPTARWIGVMLACVGLGILLWPSDHAQLPFWGTVAMLVATAGWAAYTILGQSARDPLAYTTANFILCFPVVAVIGIVSLPVEINAGGLVTATASGAVTSGLGYMLWYRVLPKLATTTAAVSQLSVPVIAVGFGAILLGEIITFKMIIASVLVLGGIAFANVSAAPARHK